MKKNDFKLIGIVLSRNEMRGFNGGKKNEDDSAVETCAYYAGCGTGCVTRRAGSGGWEYSCTYCCLA